MSGPTNVRFLTNPGDLQVAVHALEPSTKHICSVQRLQHHIWRPFLWGNRHVWVPRNSSKTKTMWNKFSVPHGICWVQEFPQAHHVSCVGRFGEIPGRRQVLWMFAKMWASLLAPEITAPGSKRWGNVKSTRVFHSTHSFCSFGKSSVGFVSSINIPKTWWSPQKPMVNTDLYLFWTYKDWSTRISAWAFGRFTSTPIHSFGTFFWMGEIW